MRMPTPWVFALAALLLAGVTVDVVRAAPRATLCESLQPYVHLLHRRSVRDRLHVAVVWYVGNPSDSLRIRSLLPLMDT